MEQAEFEERKKNFYLTIKTQNWGKIMINMVVASLFLAYFI